MSFTTTSMNKEWIKDTAVSCKGYKESKFFCQLYTLPMSKNRITTRFINIYSTFSNYFWLVVEWLVLLPYSKISPVWVCNHNWWFLSVFSCQCLLSSGFFSQPKNMQSLNKCTLWTDHRCGFDLFSVCGTMLNWHSVQGVTHLCS